MSELIDFETGLPIWSAEVYHNTPNTPGIWFRAFNAETEEKAIEKAIELFAADGLPIVRIIDIQITELKSLWEGGENGRQADDGGRTSPEMGEGEG